MELDKYKKRTDVSESTLSSRMSALNRLDSFIGGGEPTVEDVEDWIDHLIELHERGEIKSSTIRQYLKAAKYYFDLVKGEPDALGHISRWLPDKDVDHGEYLTEEEWEAMRQQTYNYRDRAIFELMYWFARRPGEVRLLNVEDVDLEEGTITFPILKKEKDDRGQLLPKLKLLKDGEVYEEHRIMRATFEMMPEPKEHLEQHLKYRPDRTETVIYDGKEMEASPLFTATNPRISYDTVWDKVKKKASEVGIEKNITPKSSRHSRATHLNWAGHSPEEIADRQLVHDPDTNVIGAYVHERDEEQVREPLSTEED